MNMAGWYVNAGGYVRVDLRRAPGTMASVASQEYKLIDGCSTTLIVEDSDLIVNGHPCQYYDFLVRQRGQPHIYIFEADGIEGTSPNPDLQELMAIRESIRVVKER